MSELDHLNTKLVRTARIENDGAPRVGPGGGPGRELRPLSGCRERATSASSVHRAQRARGG